MDKATTALTQWQLSSVAQSCPALRPHEPQRARPPCPSPTPESSQTHVHWIGDAIQPSWDGCRPLLLLPSSFPSIRGFSNESALRIRWPKYWSFIFKISPSNEHPGLISFRMDCLDLLVVQGTLKSLLQHHSSKASILWHSAFFIVQFSCPYMTSGKTIADKFASNCFFFVCFLLFCFGCTSQHVRPYFPVLRCAKSLSCVLLFATLWMVACQAPCHISYVSGLGRRVLHHQRHLGSPLVTWPQVKLHPLQWNRPLQCLKAPRKSLLLLFLIEMYNRHLFTKWETCHQWGVWRWPILLKFLVSSP